MADTQNRVRVVIDGQNNLGPATRSAQQDLSGFEKAVGRIGDALKGLAIADVVRRLIDFGARTLENADNLAKMAERTGVSTEELSAWQHAANLAGISGDDLEIGLKKLAKTIGAAAAGGQEARDALAAVGLSARDSQGKILSVEMALDRIADKFQRTADGTQKAALAQEIFGRSGTMLIPLLDQGSAGLAKMREEAERLGLVLSGKDAAAMERLSDQFKNLGEGSKGVMQTFLAGLAPELSKLFDAIYRLYEPLINTGEGLEYVRAIGSGLGGLIDILAIGFDLLATGIGLAVDKLSLFVGGIGAMASGQFSAGVEKLKQLVGLSEDARAELLLAEHSEFTKSVLGPGTPASLKKTGSGDLAQPQKDADKLAQQLLKNRLDRERAGVEFEKALGSEQQQRLDELLKHELISYSDYYDQRKQLSIATAQAEYDSLSRQAALTLDAVGKIKDATKRAGLQDEYFKLTAQQDLALQKLRSLQGLTPGGQIDAQAAQLDGMNRAAGMAGQVGRQVDTVFSDLQTRSERVQFLVSTRQITELEGEKQLNQIRGEAADRLRDMVTQYQAMAEASGDPKLIENGKRMGEQIDELAHKTSMLRTSVIDAAQNGFENFFNTLISGTGGALKAFKNFATSVLGDIGRIISKMLAMYAVEKLVGLFLGAVGGGKGGTISDTGLNPPLGGSGVTNAAGGADVEAGQPLFVGETGEPELFVPHQSGTIVPQHRLATMGGATFIYEIDARGATPGERERMLSALRQTEDRAVMRSMVAVGRVQRTHS
jgi:ribosomal protein L12E/L44/L45/RPP1/RPP2